jgi:hypothetical protein
MREDELCSFAVPAGEALKVKAKEKGSQDKGAQ